MDNKTIIDYVLNSPENTNPVILNQMLDELKGGSVQMLKFVKDSYSLSVVEDEEAGGASWDLDTSIEDFSQYDFVIVTNCTGYGNPEDGSSQWVVCGTYSINETASAVEIPASFVLSPDGDPEEFSNQSLLIDPESKLIQNFPSSWINDNYGFNIKLEFCKYVLE